MQPANHSITRVASAMPFHAAGDELAQLRVLVIDDEPLIGGLIVRLLSRSFVTFAESAPAALARLDAGESFDRILCDVVMPRMGAREFSHELETRYPRFLSVLAFMTGGVTSEEDADFLAASTRPLLQKPFCPQELVEVLRVLPRD